MKKFVFAIVILLVTALAAAEWVLPSRIEASMNRTIEHAPFTVSSEAQALHDTLFIADLHADSLLWKRDLSKQSTVGHVDLPRLKQGNVALQVFSATTKSPANMNYEGNDASSDDITKLAIASLWPPRTWNSIFERAVYQLDKLHALAANSDLVLIRDKSQMRDFVAQRNAGEDTIAAIYLIEGAHPLEGDIENLDRLFENGLRIAGLTHFFDNELGGSLHGISDEGLTDFGRQVIQRANQLGIIIDIAHASPAMVDDVLELSTRPTLLSHGGVSGNCDTPRNLTDDQMRRFAAAGGLLGIGYWDAAVCDPSPAGIVRAIRYAIDLLGVEHVALGSDYDGTVSVMFDTSELAVLTHEMLRAGFSENEIRMVMGENVKRFLLEQLPD